jgi:hypothetical protein
VMMTGIMGNRRSSGMDDCEARYASASGQVWQLIRGGSAGPG